MQHTVCAYLMSIVVRTVHAVDAPHLPSPWTPKTKTVDGVVFCRLSKWDRGLIRFAKGEALDFRRKADQTSNLAIMDDLCKLRNTACDVEFKNIGAEGSPGDGARKPKKYVRKARRADAHILPSSVVVTLPTMVLLSGDVIEGFDIRVLAEGVRTSEVYVEMTSEVMTYIWEVVQKSSTRGRHRQKHAATERHRSRSRSSRSVDEAGDS